MKKQQKLKTSKYKWTQQGNSASTKQPESTKQPSSQEWGPAAEGADLKYSTEHDLIINYVRFFNGWGIDRFF